MESETDKNVSKKAICIKEVSIISKIQPDFKMDKKSFKPKELKAHLEVAAPKIDAVIKKIKELDAKSKTKYKHVIYVDSKGAYAKIVAAGLIAHGFNLAFDKDLELDEAKLIKDGNKGNNFGFLCGSTMYDKTFPSKFKKQVNALFNRRPDNVYGDYMRILLLDSAHREGIDTFDVKYLHIIQDLTNVADRKQAIGRSTRMCGQKGLVFNPTNGWELQVYIYDESIPNSASLYELYLQYSDIDLRLWNLAPEMDKMIQDCAVDRVLTTNIHDRDVEMETHPLSSLSSSSLTPMDIDTHKLSSSSSAKFLKTHKLDKTDSSGGAKNRKNKRRNNMKLLPKPPQTKKTLADMAKYISERFMKFAWPEVKMENLCGYAGPDTLDMEISKTAAKLKDMKLGGVEIINFTPSQEFVRHYFQPSSAYKGMLAFHSVGTGKSCTAIATASTAWEPRGYTILYVTRTALRSDIYKNLFNQVCSVVIKQQIKEGLKLPENAIYTPTKYMSKNWFLPISLRQFSNICEKKNAMYHELVKRNGEKDPLKKTLVILDEAHKLFASDVIGAERPNTSAIYDAVHHSYDISGIDSVRILMMTATPYTSDPMDFIKLLNLLRPADEAIPYDIDTFSKTYLDDDGTFNSNGGNIFANKIAGYISYLNRSEDMRQFARPEITHVTVPMSLTPKADNTVEVIDAQIAKLKTQELAIVEQTKEAKRIHKEHVKSEGARQCAGERTVKERKLCQDKVKHQLLVEHNRDLERLDNATVATKESLIELKQKRKLAKESSQKMMKADLSQETALTTRCKLSLNNNSKAMS